MEHGIGIVKLALFTSVVHAPEAGRNGWWSNSIVLVYLCKLIG
jgi:hypothetical protein